MVEARRATSQVLGGRRPLPAALIGAACISSAAIVVRLAGSAAGTTAFYRCALALPVLVPLVLLEARRHGRRPVRCRLGAVLGGLFLAVDLLLWTHSVYDVGAGIATVLLNLQVLFVTVFAWLALGERPGRAFGLTLPIVLGGVVLTAGLVGRGPAGDHPVAGVLDGLGTSVAFALFLLVLRRNTRGHPHVAGPLAPIAPRRIVRALGRPGAAALEIEASRAPLVVGHHYGVS